MGKGLSFFAFLGMYHSVDVMVVWRDDEGYLFSSVL